MEATQDRSPAFVNQVVTAAKTEFGYEWTNSLCKRWGHWNETTAEDLNSAWYKYSQERDRVVVLEKDLKTFLNPESSFNETFDFVEDLGKGDMSVGVSLWRGQCNQQYAIKKFSSHNKSAATDHEFKIGVDLAHDNISKVFHCVRKHEGQTYFDYLVMEYVDGQTISDWFKAHDVSGTLIKQAQGALAHMGERQIWPADLREGNLMVTSEGALKFIDFGFYYRPDDNYSASSSSEDDDSQDDIITINLRSSKTN